MTPDWCLNEAAGRHLSPPPPSPSPSSVARGGVWGPPHEGTHARPATDPQRATLGHSGRAAECPPGDAVGDAPGMHRRERRERAGRQVFRIPDFQVPTYAPHTDPAGAPRDGAGESENLETWEPGDLLRVPAHAHSGRSMGTCDPKQQSVAPQSKRSLPELSRVAEGALFAASCQAASRTHQTVSVNPPSGVSVVPVM